MGVYQKLLRSTFPSIGETKIFSIFKTCLDPASALQLQREHEDNSPLSAGGFMAIMERDFGKVFSTQAREDWRIVVRKWEEPNSERMANFSIAI